MKILDKIVKGDIAPKQTGVLWLNTTDGKLYTFDESGKGWVPEYDADTVKEVDTLPEITEDNKTKIFKLKDEANLYAPALIKSTSAYTNRLPDEEQIDKAYLYVAGDEPYYYKGNWKLICSDGEISGYGWLETYPGGDEWYFFLTQDNAENVSATTKAWGLGCDDGSHIDLENHTITNNGEVISTYVWSDAHGLDENSVIPIPAIYNAPEANQSGSASVFNTHQSFDQRCFYKEGQVTVEFKDGILTGYLWIDDNNGEHVCLSQKPASEMYAYYNEGLGAYLGDFKIFDLMHIDSYWYDPSSPSIWHASSSLSINDCIDIVGEKYVTNLTIIPLNASDSEQVGSAYVDIQWTDEDPFEKYMYNGPAIIHCSDGDDTSKYLWGYNPDSSHFYLTKKNAESFYGIDFHFLAVNYEDIAGLVDWEGDKVFSFSGTIQEFQELFDGAEEDVMHSCNTLSVDTVPYQRTEHTEQWDYVSAFPVIEKRILMKYGDGDGKYMNLPTEGFVNVNGETMEYKGKTYYKWICIEETEAGKSRNRDVLNESQEVLGGQIMILLTTSLDPALPFSPNSPEWAYLISSEDYEDIYNAQDDPIAQEAYIDKFGNMTIRV